MVPIYIPSFFNQHPRQENLSLPNIITELEIQNVTKDQDDIAPAIRSGLRLLSGLPSIVPEPNFGELRIVNLFYLRHLKISTHGDRDGRPNPPF